MPDLVVPTAADKRDPVNSNASLAVRLLVHAKHTALESICQSCNIRDVRCIGIRKNRGVNSDRGLLKPRYTV